MHLVRNLQKPNFTVGNIDVLKVIREAGYTHSYRNGRTKHGFLYVVNGMISYNFLPEHHNTIVAKAGELVFIPQGSTYVGTYLEDDTQLKIVQFDISEGTLPPYLTTPQVLPLPGAEDLIEGFFKPMHSHPFYDLSCFYRLLWQIDECRAHIPSRYNKLQAVIRELSTHFRETFPISHYAALCDMSEPNFRRLFREYTGQSPVDYRNMLRLNDARVKLQSGEYTVSEAAETSGFSNLSFFIRLYKKKYGYTPKKE